MRCSKETIEEWYVFGQKLASESLERVRNIERRGALFAAYGIGVVTLLTSGFSTWANHGNRHTIWIAICAVFCAALSTYYAIDVSRLRLGTFESEDEWLNEECMNDSITLKRYRILMLWDSIDLRSKQHQDQGKELRCAEKSLVFSASFLVLLLVHLAFLQLFGLSIERHPPAQFGWFFLYWSVIGDIATLLIICGIFLRLRISLRGIRSFRFLRHDGENYKSYETHYENSQA